MHVQYEQSWMNTQKKSVTDVYKLISDIWVRQCATGPCMSDLLFKNAQFISLLHENLYVDREKVHGTDKPLESTLRVSSD